MGIRPGDWLYKYVSAEGLLRILEQRTIRFTQPDYLNDPYECHLTLDRKSRGKLISDYSKTLRESLPSMSGKAAREKAAANEVGLIDMALTHYRDVRNELGILSLSDAPDNILLWAHYAHEHRGAAVGLDFCHPSLIGEANGGEEYAWLHRVRYTSRKIAGVPSRDTVIESLTRKSIEWKYEREWRLVRTLNLLREANEKVFVADIAPEAITHIVLGARFPVDFGERFTREIGRGDLGHVLHGHAVTMPHRFGVKVVSAEEYAWMRLHRSHHFGSVAEEALSCIPMIQDEARTQAKRRGGSNPNRPES